MSEFFDKADWSRDARTFPERSINLRRVPLPLAGNDRYPWRMLSTLTALEACRGAAASVEQLHTLVWALRDERNAVVLLSEWHRQAARTSVFRGYEPDLLGTLRVAHSDGLVTQSSTGRQQLTDAGRSLLAEFRESGGSLGRQEDLISTLSPIAAAAMWRRLGGTN